MANLSSANSAVRRRELSVDDYVDGVTGRDRTILARTLTLVESSHPQHQQLAEEVLTRLLPSTGQSVRVGITGVPGAGKSTFIEALGMRLLQQEHRVAVLAVDPSSGVTGGSILADKTRMTHLAAQQEAFIRPSPSAGTLGGVASKTREALLICEAAGFDVILVETVGVGQSETMVAHMTDCFVALVLTGAGDDLQGIKRGLLELVDVIVVNKAEGPNRAAAEVTARQYRSALALLAGGAGHADNSVLTCSALHDQGVGEVWRAIADRCQRMKQQGTLTQRRRRQDLHWLWAVVEERLLQSLALRPQVQQIRAELENDVLEGRATVESAARRILDAFALPSP